MNINDRIAALIDQLARFTHPRLSKQGQLWRALRALRAKLPRRRPLHRSGLILEAFATAYPHASFIQIGANDGAQHDPLRTAILKQHWKGILIEPVPFVFERLQNYYQNFDRIKLENVAIADYDGSKPFFHLRQITEQEALPRWYDGIGSFNREVVLKHVDRIPDIQQRLVTTQVPCLRFDSLCARYGIERLDLIQMDTEGYDFEIIRRIDLTRFRPVLIMYEHHHLSVDDRQACESYLHDAGYDTLCDGLDTLGFHHLAAQERGSRLSTLWDQLAQKGPTS